MNQIIDQESQRLQNESEKRAERKLERLRRQAEEEAAEEEADRVAQVHANDILVFDTCKKENDQVKSLNSANVSVLISDAIQKNTSTNIVITGKTQAGKTDQMIAIIDEAAKRGRKCIVSTDNSKAQMSQTLSRINTRANDDIFSLKKMSSIAQLTRKDIPGSDIILLNNATNIKKLDEFVTGKNYDFIVLIHDEADMILSNDNVILNDTNKKAHNEWVKFTHKLERRNVVIIRVFITATPEAIHKIFKVKSRNTISMIKSSGYIGVKNIEFIESIGVPADVVKQQVERIKRYESNEVILIIDQRVKVSQQIDAIRISNLCKVPVTTYQSNDTSTTFVTKSQVEDYCKFTREIKNAKTTLVNEYTVKVLIDIAEHYKILSKIGVKCTITIGKDLMNRGVSFVSNDKTTLRPLTATTLFYNAPDSAHAVNITQVCGRIMGCASPYLKRRLFTNKEAWKTLNDFDTNQDLYIEQIEKMKNNEVDTIDVIQSTPLHKIKKTDRACLKIKPLGTRMPEPPIYTEIEGEIDGVKINSIRKWTQAETVVARMMKALYGVTGSITEGELKELINYTGSDEELKSNIFNGSSLKAKHGKVWTCRSGKICLNHKIRTFLDSIM